MPETASFNVAHLAPTGLSQLLYALNFCDPRITGVSVSEGELRVRFEAVATPSQSSSEPQDAPAASVARKVRKLIERYAQGELAFADATYFRTSYKRGNPADVAAAMVKLGVLVSVGQGRVVLRGWLARLLEAIDREAVRRIATPMGAHPESYPITIGANELAKTQHLSSFPEHLHFVSHLRGDLDLIDRVGAMARESGGYSEAMATTIQDASAPPDLIINPSVCYHCYASRVGTSIEGEGTVVTARSRCHRWEGGALSSMRRLCDFDMREVIFLGHPDFVKDRRADAEERIATWAEEWELDAAMVNANDPFFTDDFEVKAAFQRRQEAKHELTVPMPDGRPMAIASSNFHSITFGKAFGITRGGRPICTGCVGFGLERWTYAIALQHGVDPKSWPREIRDAMERT